MLFICYNTSTPVLLSFPCSWKIWLMWCLTLSLNSADLKADKTSLYNFSKLKKNRKWLKVYNISLSCLPSSLLTITHPQLLLATFFLCLLQSILLSDDTTDSDTDSDDSDFSLSREELHDMLRLHRYTRQHQSKFHTDREVHMHTKLNTIRSDI